MDDATRLDRIERVVTDTNRILHEKFRQQQDLKSEMDEVRDTINDWIPMMGELQLLISGGTRKDPLNVRLANVEHLSLDNDKRIRGMWGVIFVTMLGVIGALLAPYIHH